MRYFVCVSMCVHISVPAYVYFIFAIITLKKKNKCANLGSTDICFLVTS